MDRRCGVNSRPTRSRSDDSHISRERRDYRDNGQGRMVSPRDARYREEAETLLQKDPNERQQVRGRSRSPKRQENRRNHNRRESPNRRVSWQDNVDGDSKITRSVEQSPGGHRRGREQPANRSRDQSPGRGRQQSPKRGRKQSPQPVRTHPASPNQPVVAANTQSLHKSRHEISMQQQSVGYHKSRRKSRSQSRSRSRSRSRSQSPHKEKRRHQKSNRKAQHKRRLRTTDARILDAETATARLSITSIVLHILAIGTSLMVIVPMSLVSSRWQSVRRTCPVYVHNNIGVTVDWGNPNMLVCHIIAYLPVVILILSFSLLLFHYGIMHTWYTNKIPPKFALTRKHAVGTMILVFLEAVVAWCIACLLTDGFRQTCLSFELTPYPEDRPISCKYGFDDRDETYFFQDLNTFEKIMIAMLGAWVCVIVTTILTVSLIVRACCCYST